MHAAAYGANHDRLVALKNEYRSRQPLPHQSQHPSDRGRVGEQQLMRKTGTCVYAAMVMGLSVVAATMTSAHAAPNDAAQSVRSRIVWPRPSTRET